MAQDSGKRPYRGLFIFAVTLMVIDLLLAIGNTAVFFSIGLRVSLQILLPFFWPLPTLVILVVLVRYRQHLPARLIFYCIAALHAVPFLIILYGLLYRGP